MAFWLRTCNWVDGGVGGVGKGYRQKAGRPEGGACCRQAEQQRLRVRMHAPVLESRRTPAWECRWGWCWGSLCRSFRCPASGQQGRSKSRFPYAGWVAEGEGAGVEVGGGAC